MTTISAGDTRSNRSRSDREVTQISGGTCVYQRTPGDEESTALDHLVDFRHFEVYSRSGAGARPLNNCDSDVQLAGTRDSQDFIGDRARRRIFQSRPDLSRRDVRHPLRGLGGYDRSKHQ